LSFKKVSAFSNAFLGGFKNGYDKRTHLLTTNERKQLFKTMQDRMRAKQQAESKKALEKAETFLKDNKNQNKDILETKSGLQYRVVRKGKGKSPDSAADQVRVNYEGKLVDGTIFDSSYEKGEPFVTRLNRVIKGWTEGIQLMNEGSEYEFFIHPRLAYGPRPNNNIPANSVLIFKVELQKVFEKNIK
jgi:FKBP-type peptidyl-prolyl cis-trans isomerase FklB